MVGLVLLVELDVFPMRHELRNVHLCTEDFAGEPDAMMGDRVEVRCDEAKNLDRQGGERVCAVCWWNARITA